MMISFTDREDLDKENLGAIRKSGFRFRGKGNWPQITDIEPGFVPVFPQGKALEDLPVILEQAAAVLEKAVDDPEYLYPEGSDEYTVLVRMPVGKPGRERWEDHYEKMDSEKGILRFKLTYKRESCAEVSRLQVSPVTLQLDLVMLPSPVMERGSRGYFPFVLLLVNKANGMVSGMTMLSPDPDLKTMRESVPQKLLEEIAKLEYRPEAIEIRSDLLYGLVEDALKEAWCRPVKVEQMPQMEEAVGSLISHLGSGH
jgi:hypothetical protein